MKTSTYSKLERLGYAKESGIEYDIKRIFAAN